MFITRRTAILSAATALAASASISGRAIAKPVKGVKVVELLARKADISHAAFTQQWARFCGQASKIPGLRGYIAQDVTANPPARTDIVGLVIPVDIDGIAELWFDSIASMNTAYASAAGKAWLASKAKFVGGMKGYVGTQDVIIPIATPRPALKNTNFLARKPGTTPADFRKDWHVVHGEMALKVPFIKGFVLLDVAPAPAQGIPLIPIEPIDGIAETYYDNSDDQKKMIASPEAKVWFADGAAHFGKNKGYNTTFTNYVTPPI